MKKIITIKDVALQSGVSISTVSRVLNGLDRVSNETKVKVLNVVKELNYTPNNLAVSMIKKKSQMIVAVVPTINNPFYTAVIEGVEEVAKSEGYHTFVFSTNDRVEEEEELFSGVLGKIVDGVIVIPSSKDSKIYRDYFRPIVMVDRYLIDSCWDGVVIDNFGGSYQITQKLIQEGHKDIAIVTGPMDFNIGIDRYAGYVKALKDNGIKLNDEYIIKGSWEIDNGYDSVSKFLSLNKKPTAIYATNNMICMGVIKALYDMKIKIGEEISLVGFDDNILARLLDPPVTFVDRPTVEMGRVAARLLINKIKNIKSSTIATKSTLGVNIINGKSIKKLN